MLLMRICTQGLRCPSPAPTLALALTLTGELAPSRGTVVFAAPLREGTYQATGGRKRACLRQEGAGREHALDSRGQEEGMP